MEELFRRIVDRVMDGQTHHVTLDYRGQGRYIRNKFYAWRTATFDDTHPVHDITIITAKKGLEFRHKDHSNAYRVLAKSLGDPHENN